MGNLFFTTVNSKLFEKKSVDTIIKEINDETFFVNWNCVGTGSYPFDKLPKNFVREFCYELNWEKISKQYNESNLMNIRKFNIFFPFFSERIQDLMIENNYVYEYAGQLMIN